MSDDRVERLALLLRRRGAMLATAESCTGGLVAAACTSVAGSSDWFERGFVTYSNAAKTDLLDVPAEAIATHGAVSREVALAMAEGALGRSCAGLAVAVTGVAGPGGGTAAKPVGTVWIAVAERGRPSRAVLLRVSGDRASVREQSVWAALDAVIDAAGPANDTLGA